MDEIVSVGEEFSEVTEQPEITLEELLGSMKEEISKIDMPSLPQYTENIDVKEEENKEIEQEKIYISGDELDELEQEMSSIIENTEIISNGNESLLEQINDLQSRYQQKEDEIQAIEALWSKVQENKILGKLVQDFLEGKEVDIPQIVSNKIKEDIDSMPSIDNTNSVSVPKKEVSLTDVFASMPIARFEY